MPNWDFWAWLTYICIGLAAVVLAGDAAVKGSTNLTLKFQSLRSTKFWNFAPLVLILISAGLLVLRAYGVASSPVDCSRDIAQGPLIQITGKSFYNERVLLDGHAYSDCRFDHVTLVTNGGGFSLAHNDFITRPIISTDDPRILGAITVLAKMDLLKYPLGINGQLIAPGITNAEGPPPPPK